MYWSNKRLSVSDFRVKNAALGALKIPENVQKEICENHRRTNTYGEVI
jgi:hypothetical protein